VVLDWASAEGFVGGSTGSAVSSVISARRDEKMRPKRNLRGLIMDFLLRKLMWSSMVSWAVDIGCAFKKADRRS
jgi:hypothetical protein